MAHIGWRLGTRADKPAARDERFAPRRGQSSYSGIVPKAFAGPLVLTETPTGSGLAQTPLDPNEWKGTARYRIVRRIGEGATGVVYEAFDRERAQAVAVKTLSYFTPAALYSFKQEFRTLADVHHQNLVLLHELVVTEGEGAFFVMELVPGTDFQSYVMRPADQPPAGVIPSAESLQAGAAARSAPPALGTSPADFDKLRGACRQLVEGVRVLHGAGKLHRDIKPSNILVTPEGRVVIMDFGVATELPRLAGENLSEERAIVGTISYMSPEQALAEEPSAASDWYSVGVMLYEALTGTPPFVGTAIEILTNKTLCEAAPPSTCVLGVPPDLDSLCRALLECDPKKRPTGPEILRRLGATRSVRPIPSLGLVVDGAHSTSLVGREPQLRALRDAFEEVLSGRSITVRVTGASGMGKSAVTQLFLDGLIESGAAVVLRGRAYERESVPFKAIDSVIDALSGYLIHLEEHGGAVALPDDIAVLARVFPVLRRVPSVSDFVSKEAAGPQVVRQRAFFALRELLTTLTNRKPLVIYIDDVQWGDADSAALLLELTRPPHAPAVLFVMTQRDEDLPTSPFLKEMRDRWPAQAESRTVTVGPLDQADARRLALTLLDASDAIARRTAEAVARESRGNPFLLEELARSNLSVSRSDTRTLAVLSLEQMVSQRLERLPDQARLLAELVAVGGRPLPIALIAQAAGMTSGVDEAIGLARMQRLLRTGLRDTKEIVEAAHDRFRETIVRLLDSQTLLEHHTRLADAFEASPGLDAEAVAVHQRAAGRNDRATWYSEQAAEEAVSKMAFEQAARLFLLTLETTAPGSEQARRLRTRLAQVLEWSGRGEEAARAYLEAADGAPTLQRAELERAASVGLFSSGRIVEGAEVLRRAFVAVGLKTPESALGTLLCILIYRVQLLWLSLFGFRFVERETDAISPGDRLRIDLLFAASIGFGLSNVVLGRCTATHGLLKALRRGDRFQILRAATLELANHASGKQRKLERALVALTTRLAEKEGSGPVHERDAAQFVQGGPSARTLFLGNLMTNVYLRGEWKRARKIFDEFFAGTHLQDLRGGWQSSRKVFGCWTLNFLGEHRELARLHSVLLAEAEKLDDKHMSVQLRDGSLAIMWLAADDPEGARRNAEESMALWPSDRYLLQHWHRLYGEGEIELYVGDGAKAYARVDRDTKALKKSLLLRIQHMRAQTMFLRGRCAIASLEAQPALRNQRLLEIRRLVRRLEREGMAWTAPFAAILRAAVANAQGNRSAAIAGLRAAVDLATAADMSGYARAARHQLGLLLGGDEGEKLVAEAAEAMRAEGILVPARFAATLVPGRWAA
jgi:serine/threonine protein kinase